MKLWFILLEMVAFSLNRHQALAFIICPQVSSSSKITSNISAISRNRNNKYSTTHIQFYTRCTGTTNNRNRYDYALSVAGSATMIASQTATASLLTQLVQIKHDPFYVLSSVLLLSVFGISLEKRTTIGKALSAPLATMALALIVANLGLMPFSSPVYEFINRYLIPLAIPLLLYDSDLKRVITDTGSLFLAFILGALSTVIATICSYKLIPLSSLGEEGWKVGCALAARHIGGAINFVAVCETLNVGGSIVSAAIAADNVVVALYFAFLFYLAQPDDAATRSSSDNSEDKNARDIISKENITEEEIEQTGEEITMPSLAISIMVASCLATIGKIITKLMLPEGTSVRNTKVICFDLHAFEYHETIMLSY